MRIGVKLDNYGPQANRLLESAQVADEAGFSSVWVSDRLINPATQTSPYPFTPDNSVPWPPDVTFHEAVVSMAAVAAVTKEVEVGVGVLVLPLRHPVLVAKQLASLDALSGGRVVLGAGIGWMAEEFEAVGIPFEERGRRTDEAIKIVRALWNGPTEQIDGSYYRVAAGTHSFPRPLHEIPVIVGGMTPAALRRAGRHGDGWLGIVKLETLDLAEVRRLVGGVREAAEQAGRDPQTMRCVLRVAGAPTDVARVADDIERAGVDELVLDVTLNDVDVARAALEAVAGMVGSA